MMMFFGFEKIVFFCGSVFPSELEDSLLIQVFGHKFRDKSCLCWELLSVIGDIKWNLLLDQNEKWCLTGTLDSGKNIYH